MIFHDYQGFTIAILSATNNGITQYWYRISGNGLRVPVETNERFDDAGRSLGFAKDFVDEHLAPGVAT